MANPLPAFQASAAWICVWKKIAEQRWQSRLKHHYYHSNSGISLTQQQKPKYTLAQNIMQVRKLLALYGTWRKQPNYKGPQIAQQND